MNRSSARQRLLSDPFALTRYLQRYISFREHVISSKQYGKNYKVVIGIIGITYEAYKDGVGASGSSLHSQF